MLTVTFGESTMSITQVQLWYNLFKDGQEDINNDVSPVRLITPTTDKSIEAVKKMILDNRRITIKEVADVDNISFSSQQTSFTLDMKYTAAEIVPKLLNFK